MSHCYIFYLYVYCLRAWLNIVPDIRVGHCLGPEGNEISSGEGGEGGPGPTDKKGDNQSAPSMEGGNTEQEEEGKKSQA
jgi:hypothetical protein